MNRSISDYPENYRDSRQRFRSQVAILSKQIPSTKTGQFPVPSKCDPDLSVDYAFFPTAARPRDLLILSSGVHGPEAYAGSAIQSLFLREILPECQDNLAVLLIHSVNPYGFQFHRRVTENNINLNRNFGLDASLFQTQNEGYDKLKAILVPKEPVAKPIRESAGRQLHLLKLVALGRASIRDLTAAIAGGQYQLQDGIEFGGHEFEPQIQPLRRLLFECMEPYSRVVHLDLHTGLGSASQLHIISSHNAPESEKLMQTLFQTNKDGDLYDIVTGSTEGYYPTKGGFTQLSMGLGQSHQQVLSVTAEFGTIGDSLRAQLKSLNCLIHENQGFHFGYANQRIEKQVKGEFLELFYPPQSRWKHVVLEKAQGVLQLIIRRLEQA